MVSSRSFLACALVLTEMEEPQIQIQHRNDPSVDVRAKTILLDAFLGTDNLWAPEMMSLLLHSSAMGRSGWKEVWSIGAAKEEPQMKLGDHHRWSGKFSSRTGMELQP